ncbi:hypothetical protein [Aquabacterium sp.]|uniref:hypothetical protein n=1 Tax=Aquabacterium sp. TaxID=1872578 RepID=UPI002BE104A2|nr:hypothetical protein [Aquabacterium sp.]HSW07977.1 hypothetical protein [Aquabacterium sp.]
MTSTDAAALPVRHFPSRVASLGFAMRLPVDWVSHELPADTPDFEDPTRLVPLAAVTAPHAAIVWAVAARPAYGDGTLSDWAHYLLAQHGLDPRSFGESRLGLLPALVGEAEQPSDLGPLRVRFAFAEDGGRLINLSLTAPVLLADAVQGLWASATESFTLEEPAGPTVALWPAVQEPPQQHIVPDLDLGDTMALQIASVPQADHAAALADVQQAQVAQARVPQAQQAPAQEIHYGESAATQAVGPPPADSLHDHALADDAASLNPEHPTNRRLRDSGVGLVPRLVTVNSAERCATVACGAVSAQIDLPLGWHVIDDGRRVLVFEPKGDVQIHLDLLAIEGDEITSVLDALENQVHRDYPDPQCLRLASGTMVALNVRNIRDGDEPIEQFHLLVPGPDARHVLRARVTAALTHATAAANLGELVLHSAVFGSFAIPAAAGETGPDWWMAALLLERANRLNEAEDCITSAVDHIGAALQVAELYRHRMLRLLREGDNAGADHARTQAVRWVQHYAASATSGGEGVALSRERDAFLARL